MTNAGRVRIGGALAVVALLALACAPIPAPAPVPEARRVPPQFPEAFYRSARERGDAVFRIDPERSEAVIYVYRGGSLAQLGHNHVVASRDVHGYVLLNYAPVDVRAESLRAIRFVDGG